MPVYCILVNALGCGRLAMAVTSWAVAVKKSVLNAVEGLVTQLAELLVRVQLVACSQKSSSIPSSSNHEVVSSGSFMIVEWVCCADIGVVEVDPLS